MKSVIAFALSFIFFNCVQAQIVWNGLPIWAKECDFIGNDLFAVHGTPDYLCSKTCSNVPNCTHFSFTTFYDGTCWLKQGPAYRERAVSTNDPTMVCGIVLEGDFELRKGALIWADEFDSIATLNQNWEQEVGGGGWGNNELQYYTTDNRNTIINNGFLTIQARLEDFGGRRFTSARLISRNNFQYGVYEMRAKLPRGRGTWPAFWLLGANRPLNWPDDGEIDIMEHVGYDQDIVHGTIHCKAHYHSIGTQVGNLIQTPGASDGFNLYQLEWTPTSIKAFRNGKFYFRYDKPALPTYQTWPFDNQMNMLLNFAVGGDWGGAQGIDESVYPQDYVIDYVRVYAHV
jgi:hypothetical protein